MRKYWTKIVSMALCMVFVLGVGAGSSQAAVSALKMPAVAKNSPVAKNGRLSVSGNKVVNSKGKTFVIKGVSTHGLSWYPEYVNKAGFKSLRDDFGVNTIRLALYTEGYNGYCVGGAQNRKDLKALVDKGVKYATELGMYVIIDWHILSDGNPKTYQKQAVSFFKEIAQKYKKHTNVLYEICNEPNGAQGSWKNIKSYAEKVVKEIRKIDKKAIIIVGTPTWSQDVDVAANDKITGYKNIAYAFHFYAGTHQANMRSKLESAVKGGLPVIVSEFGITDASGNGGINTSQGDKWMTLLNKYSIGRVCWNLSNKNEGSALIKSSSKKTSKWSASNLTTQGKWLLKAYTGKTKTSVTASGSTGTAAKSVSKGGITVKQVHSWKQGSKYYYQYNVTIKNTGSKKSKGWTGKIQFDAKPKLSQGWCGKYSVSGKTITVKPLSYNKKIAKKESVEIGFIVSSSKKLSLGSAKVTFT